MKKVLITGPESSGKSFLSEKLSAHYNGLWIPEFAREYLELHPNYQESDLLEIAIGQEKQEKEALSSGVEFVFFDTSIEVVCIWSMVKYNLSLIHI